MLRWEDSQESHLASELRRLLPFLSTLLRYREEVPPLKFALRSNESYC